jgi:hypothetical protein
MNIKIIALTVALILVGISAPTRYTTSISGQGTVKAISQEADAKLIVEGPSRAGVGDLVVISVEKSSAMSFKWLVTPSTDNLLVIDGGKRIVFSSGTKGTFTFIIACGLGDSCDLATHTLVIGDAPPENVLSSKIASWCDKVTSSSKRLEALALANSFLANANRIEAGALVTAKEIVEATFESNKKALGDSHQRWMPFREELAKELTSMANVGLLADAQAHREAWLDIHQSLVKYAESL